MGLRGEGVELLHVGGIQEGLDLSSWTNGKTGGVRWTDGKGAGTSRGACAEANGPPPSTAGKERRGGGGARRNQSRGTRTTTATATERRRTAQCRHRTLTPSPATDLEELPVEAGRGASPEVVPELPPAAPLPPGGHDGEGALVYLPPERHGLHLDACGRAGGGAGEKEETCHCMLFRSWRPMSPHNGLLWGGQGSARGLSERRE